MDSFTELGDELMFKVGSNAAGTVQNRWNCFHAFELGCRAQFVHVHRFQGAQSAGTLRGVYGSRMACGSKKINQDRKDFFQDPINLTRIREPFNQESLLLRHFSYFHCRYYY